MSWSQTAYTQAGAELLAETLVGRVLTITRADAGTGLYDESDLPNVSALANVKLDLGLLSITDVTDGDGAGKKVGVQILNEGVTSTLELHQIGVYGVLDSDPDTEVLLFILQDERGIEIPSEEDTADFELDVYAVIAISNTAQISLSIDTDARASITYVQNYVAEHDADETAHEAAISKQIEEWLAAQYSALDDIYLAFSKNHRMLYRGQSLGTYVTDEQAAAIKAGTFDDIYLGDYWTINGTRYDVADFNLFYNTGSTSLTANHLVIVSHDSMGQSGMNSSDTNEGGYIGSEMYTTVLPTIKETIANDFGDLLLTHQEYLPSNYSSGVATVEAWCNVKVSLMSEIMVYGTRVVSTYTIGDGMPFGRTEGKLQLALFAVNPVASLNQRYTFWLRDEIGANYFTACYFDGRAVASGASNQNYVRPYFLIGG